MGRQYCYPLLLPIITALLSSRAEAQGQKMTGIDFVSTFRSLRGQSVTLTDCYVAGTTSTFIRCETPNRAVDYTLETDSMLPADLRRVFSACPTGSQRKLACHFVVSGAVVSSSLPSIANARLAPADE